MESEATTNANEQPVDNRRKFGKVKAGLIICLIALMILGGYTLILQIRYLSLDDTNRELVNRNLFYIDQLNDLRDDLGSMETMYEGLDAIYEDLDASHEDLDVAYEDYRASHLYTNDEYEQGRFRFYYSKPEHQRFGVYDLEDELNALMWTEPYAEGVFDCSEMTACLEWHLENRGWNAKYYAGNSPFGSGRHVWLVVETSEGAYMSVECTTLRVVFWEDPYFDEYWDFDQRFENIQEATSYLSNDFDWWQLGFCPLDYN